MNKKTFLFLFSGLVCFSTLFADDVDSHAQLEQLKDSQPTIEFNEIPLDLDESSLITKAKGQKKSAKHQKKEAKKAPPPPEEVKQPVKNKPKKRHETAKRINYRDKQGKKYSRWPAKGQPYWTWIGNVQPNKQSLFTQTNIGVGFLYFSSISGNLQIQPPTLINQFSSIPYQNKLSYNKTPIFEYMVGYRILHWFKVAFAFQNQQGISVQTQQLLARPSNPNLFAHGQLSAYLELNSLMARVFFELPYPMIWKSLAVSPYLSAGAGGGWQSWTNIFVYHTIGNPSVTTFTAWPLKQKISANGVWLVDLGFRVQCSKSPMPFSLTMGCKYNYWGQARNIGKMGDQGAHAAALTSPFKIKSVYSFVPYLGFQWNFVDTYPSYVKNPKKHQVLWDKKLGKQVQLFTQLNIGPNFLYTSGTEGYLQPIPLPIFSGAGGSPLRGRLVHNKTPIFEYLIGFQPLQWFKYAVSYQNQQGTSVETPQTPTSAPGNARGTSKLNAELELNAVMAKFYFQWFFSIHKGFFMSPYAALGIGAAWQTWANIQFTSFSELPAGTFATTDTLSFRQKISTSCAWMADLGINFTVPGYYFPFHLSLGCKYNQWGKSPNIGDITQQGTFKRGLLHPYSIKILYSFAPYMAMEWDFPVSYKYIINKKPVNRWKPFWTKAADFQKKSSIFVNTNVGVGILGFDKTRLNAGVFPTSIDPGISSAPYKENLRYNITPVYEYIIGYRMKQWLKATLSYNQQNNIYVETSFLRGYAGNDVNGVNAFAAYAQVKARLGLNMILFKPYFELPWPMVCKGWITSPYLGVGIGPTWQSWTDVIWTLANESGPVAFVNNISTPLHLRQKIMASVGWSLDLGLRIRNAVYNAPLSIVVGCKYNQWGQTVNLGMLTQQENLKIGLFKPLRIRVLFSYAPYLGVQWNF